PEEVYYKLCASIMSLSRKYEVAIIDKTCRQCRECKVFSYRKFEAILKHNSLIASEDEPTRCFEAPAPTDHANMRGSNYFK
ncbi:MAG: IS21 family transposase, partial [Prevotella sp.]|nr:IS21 family transposase [Prevotella sp.]